MKTGKIPESVLKRSVLRQIQFHGEDVQSGAGVGEDCAVFAYADGESVAACVSTVTGGNSADACVGAFTADEGAAGICAVHGVVNNLAAKGAKARAILVSIVLPPQAQEAQLKDLMKQIGDTAKELGITVAGGHTEVSESVIAPIVSVTGIGALRAADRDMQVRAGSSADAAAGGGGLHTAGKDAGKRKKQTADKDIGRCKAHAADRALPGQDVVMTKWAGLAGTALIAKKKREWLLTRYPAHLIDAAAALEKQLSVAPEAAIAGKSGAGAMHDASQGGIFAALWELAEKSGVGLEIDLGKIPIRQETVEISNYADVNPYELYACGSLLIAADNGYDLVSKLQQQGINAAVIGKVTDTNDRVVINQEERRFLEPPKSDEIHKVLDVTNIE